MPDDEPGEIKARQEGDMRIFVVFLTFFLISVAFGQADDERTSSPVDRGDYPDQPFKRNDGSGELHGLAHRVAALEKLIAGIQSSTGCSNLKYFSEVRYPIIVLDDNSGYPGPVSVFSAEAPEDARCVELEVLAAIETDFPLVGTTTAGIMVLNEIDGAFQAIGSVKVLGRAGYESYENENTSTITAPVIDGKVYYQFLNLYPLASDPSTTTAIVVSVIGYYGEWN